MHRWKLVLLIGIVCLALAPTFALGGTPTYTLSVTKAGTGSGTVTSTPAGIDCGSTCTASYASGTDVTLTATPAAGSDFTGWSGDCSGSGTCTVAMTAVRNVGAVFDVPKTSVGIYRNGEWYVDLNDNRVWDGPATDGYAVFGGLPGDVPVVGDWDGSGTTKIGIYRQGVWYLDVNGDGVWDEMTEGPVTWGGLPEDIPVVGK